MRSYIDPCDNIIFDGTDQLSASRCMDYPQLTRTKKGTFDTAVNIMWIFNCAKHLPVYYRLMPGSIKDVSAFKVCIEDSGLHDGVAIIDKGFQSSSNIARLDELGIKFIMALKRSTKGLDYSVFSSRTNEAADGAFRLIALQWYYGLGERLRKAELTSRYAPMDMVRSLSRVRTVRVNKKWIPAEIMKKDRQLVKAAGLHITPDSGIL